MKYNEIVKGVYFDSKANSIVCEICAKCNITVQPFEQLTDREKEILGLIHSDICSPMNIESFGGAKYFVTFVDDYSRYTETVMLRNKSDVFQAFKSYKCKVGNQAGKRIKKLNIDNGREYLSNDFKNFLKQEGVEYMS